MMLCFLAVILNLNPILNIHLETDAGKQAFAQKAKIITDEFSVKWEEVKQLQRNWQDSVLLLENTPKDTPEWQNASAICDSLGEVWKRKAQAIIPLSQKAQAAALTITNPGRILNIVDQHRTGQNLSDEDRSTLERVIEICEL
jgi:hypothetical protein